MTKAELVNQIAAQTGYEKATVLNVVESFMENVKGNIVNGEDIFLRGFGTFTRKTRKEKIARNIKAEVSIVVPEHDIPYFKPAKEFVQSVK